MRFSPLTVSNLIIQPLRYFYINYAGPDFLWDADPKISKIEIDFYNNLNTIPLQVKPRILVNRGSYTISPTGLTDNLSEGDTLSNNKGLHKDIRMLFISGAAIVTIETRQEGTAELMVDQVSNFLTWTSPYICDSQGFKKFALPMNISPVSLDKEDKEKFVASLSVPYFMETKFRVKDDALKLNQFFLNFNQQIG